MVVRVSTVSGVVHGECVGHGMKCDTTGTMEREHALQARRRWSRTQKTVALSSGEAEMIAVVKGVSEGLGVKALAADWGNKYKLVGLCDSSAAMGIVARKGVGKIRHLDVGMMWVQDLRE